MPIQSAAGLASTTVANGSTPPAPTAVAGGKAVPIRGLGVVWSAALQELEFRCLRESGRLAHPYMLRMAPELARLE